MTTTYPPAAPQLTGDALTIHRLLRTPALVARRLRTILEQRYIADFLLTGRFNVEGGAITYESGEPIFTVDNPRAVAPGGEYPLTRVGGGPASVAKTVKWGQDVLVTDEAIKRLLRNPVDRAFTKLANQSVRFVDSVAMSAVTSRVTTTQAASAALTAATAEQFLTDVLTAKANVVALNEGFDPDTVVLDDIRYARALAKFIAAGYLPRETTQGAIATGQFPVVNGMTFVPTPNGIAGEALVVDRQQLGGMADEDLGGPGYARADGVGVEVKTMREDEEDQYRLRARRVTVPVVVEPAAGRRITGL
jgi:hypothetical protein